RCKSTLNASTTLERGSGMTPHQAYRRNTQSGWTRVEMLLAIYDSTIRALDDGIDVLNQNNLAEVPRLRLRASQLLLLLISGIDENADQPAQQIRDLCIFCVNQVATDDISAWTGARNVLETLREGFQGVRELAIQMESNGEI